MSKHAPHDGVEPRAEQERQQTDTVDRDLVSTISIYTFQHSTRTSHHRTLHIHTDSMQQSLDVVSKLR